MERRHRQLPNELHDDAADNRHSSVPRRLLSRTRQRSVSHHRCHIAREQHPDVTRALHAFKHHGANGDSQYLPEQSRRDDNDEHGRDRLHANGRSAFQCV